MGKKLILKGGGLGSMISSIFNFIFYLILSIALFFLMLVPLAMMAFVYSSYNFANGVLAMVNAIIKGINDNIMPTVRGVVNFINGIIKVINSLTGG
jgi:phage-related protein